MLEGTSHLQRWLEFCSWPGFISRLPVTLKPRLWFILVPYICSLNPFSFMRPESGISMNSTTKCLEVHRRFSCGTNHLWPILMKNVLINRLKYGITVHPADFIYFSKFNHFFLTLTQWYISGKLTGICFPCR